MIVQVESVLLEEDGDVDRAHVFLEQLTQTPISPKKKKVDWSDTDGHFVTASHIEHPAESRGYGHGRKGTFFGTDDAVEHGRLIEQQRAIERARTNDISGSHWPLKPQEVPAPPITTVTHLKRRQKEDAPAPKPAPKPEEKRVDPALLAPKPLSRDGQVYSTAQAKEYTIKGVMAYARGPHDDPSRAVHNQKRPYAKPVTKALRRTSRYHYYSKDPVAKQKPAHRSADSSPVHVANLSGISDNSESRDATPSKPKRRGSIAVSPRLMQWETDVSKPSTPRERWLLESLAAKNRLPPRVRVPVSLWSKWPNSIWLAFFFEIAAVRSRRALRCSI